MQLTLPMKLDEALQIGNRAQPTPQPISYRWLSVLPHKMMPTLSPLPFLASPLHPRKDISFVPFAIYTSTILDGECVVLKLLFPSCLVETF